MPAGHRGLCRRARSSYSLPLFSPRAWSGPTSSPRRCRGSAVGAFDLGQPLRHALEQLVLRQTAQQGILEPPADPLPQIGARDDARGKRLDDQHQDREYRDRSDAGEVAQLIQRKLVGNRLGDLCGEPHGVSQDEQHHRNREEEQDSADDRRLQERRPNRRTRTRRQPPWPPHRSSRGRGRRPARQGARRRSRALTMLREAFAAAVADTGRIDLARAAPCLALSQPNAGRCAGWTSAAPWAARRARAPSGRRGP